MKLSSTAKSFLHYFIPSALVLLLIGTLAWRGHSARLNESSFWIFRVVAEALALLALICFILARMNAGRLAAQRHLTHSEALFRNIYQNAPVMMISIDRNGNIRDANNKCLHATGYQRQEVLGRPADFLLTAESAERLRQAAAPRPWYEGEVLGAAGQFRLQDGSVMDVQLECTRFKDGYDEPVSLAVAQDVTLRKHAEAELIKTRDEMEAVLSGLQEVMVAYIDPQMRVIWSNAHYNKKKNSPPGRERGRMCFDVLHGVTEACVDCVTLKALETGLPQEGEVHTHSGAILLARSNPLFSDTGVLTGVVHVALDITERKKAEEILRESEVRFAQVFSESPMPMGISTFGEGRLIEANKAFQNLLGYTWDEMVGRTTKDLNVFPDRAQRLRLLENLNDAGHVRNQEISIRHHDGALLTCLVSLAPVQLAGERYILSTMVDLTETKRIEAALAENRMRLQTLLDNTADGNILFDDSGRIVEVNPSACAMAGYSREEILQSRIHDFVPPEGLGEFQKRMEELMLTGYQSDEMTVLHKDGSRVDLEYRSIANVLPGQHMSSIHDVTQQKRAQEELRRASEAALASSIAKSQFLANMSHEIRTPMNGIVGMTDLLMETTLTPEQQMYGEMVRRSADALLQVINDILDFSKIEAGRIDFDRNPFDLRACVEDTAELMALQAHEKGLELACLIDPGVPAPLIGDPGRLRQVLVNLIGNAVKFTDRGEVVLRVALEGEDDSAVTLRFTVSDTGIGIPADRHLSIFEPFSQVDPSSTRRHGGTGLGLTISNRLVGMMGGAIGLESEPGRGSNFWFTARFGKQADAPAWAPANPQMLKGLRILIVDDNPTKRQILAGKVASLGCQTWTAGGGAEGLDMLRHAAAEGTPLDLAIVDLEMPDMDGAEMGRRIKADPRLAATVLIALTAHGRRGQVRELQQLGFAAYFTKPVKIALLHEGLALALGGGSSRAPQGGEPIVTRHSAADALRHRKRILLAEDNATNQQVVRHILKRVGLNIDLAANGREALDALELTAYDLVLMDIQMPVMDGMEAAAAIRERERGTGRHTRIIAMTAHAMKGDREKALAAGMDDYVTKPINPAALIKAVEAALFDEEDPQSSEAPAPPEPLPAPAPAAPAPAEVFDPDILLRRLDGDRETFLAVMADYRIETANHMAALREAWEAGDAAKVKFHAHAIKGSSANVGAEALRHAARAAEVAAASPPPADASLLEAMEREYQRLQKALEGGER